MAIKRKWRLVRQLDTAYLQWLSGVNPTAEFPTVVEDHVLFRQDINISCVCFVRMHSHSDIAHTEVSRQWSPVGGRLQLSYVTCGLSSQVYGILCECGSVSELHELFLCTWYSWKLTTKTVSIFVWVILYPIVTFFLFFLKNISKFGDGITYVLFVCQDVSEAQKIRKFRRHGDNQV